MGAQTKQRKPSDARLRELILHLSLQSQADESFGMVKLNKLLFLCDFSAYRRFGRSITGQEYLAQDLGPCPRRMKPVTDKMGGRGEFAVQTRDYYGYEQKKPVALREPNLAGFAPEEIALSGDWVRRLWGTGGRQISDASHGFIGWQVAEIGERIPYSMALISGRQPTVAERRRGLEFEELARACLARDTA